MSVYSSLIVIRNLIALRRAALLTQAIHSKKISPVVFDNICLNALHDLIFVCYNVEVVETRPGQIK